MIGRGKSGILLPAGLLAAGLILVGVMFLPTQEPVSAQTATAAAERPITPARLQEAQAKKDFTLPPLSSFDAILKRPIFSPDRRAVQGSSAVVVRQELGMTLTGISISDSKKMAILAPQEGGESVRLREGEDYRGWTLAEVERHKVVFRRGNKEEQLELVFDEPPPQGRNKKRRDRRTAQQPGKQQTKRRKKRQNQNNNQRTEPNQGDEGDEEAEQEK